MHRDKTVARILLILSVVHVAVAGPAIVRQRSPDVDEDVTAASEKRGHSDTPQDLYPVPQMGNELPTTSGISPSRDDPPPESGTAQLQNDHAQTSGHPPSQDDTSSASGYSQSHNGPPAGSNDPQLHDAPSQSRPPPGSSDGDSVHGESLSDSPQELNPVPQMNNDRPPASGAPHLHNDPPPALGNPHVYADSVESEAPDLESVHHYLENLRLNNLRPQSVPNPPPSEPESVPPSSLESDRFLSDATKLKLKFIGGYSVLIGATVGATLGIQKLIHVYSQGSKPASRNLASSDVVGRGVSTNLRLPKRPVSRALANLWDEDLGLLSVLTRRVLERLD